MKDLTAAFVTECMKLRRSKIFWITLLFFIFIPLMMGLLMFVAQHPDMASKLGLVGTKASFFDENNWEGFFLILNQSVAMIGTIGFGFITSWVFGRDYIQRTVIDILALPVSRSSIVISKFFIVALWCLLLTIIMFLSSIIIGHLIKIPDWSGQVFSQYAYKIFITSFLTLLLITPVAFIASYSKGIIAALAFVILTMIMAQFVSLVGLGPYFPWAIPGVNTVPAGTEGMQLVFGSYIILLITSILGFFGTIAWWRTADQH